LVTEPPAIQFKEDSDLPQEIREIILQAYHTLF
jgi:hypothetical protein